MQQSYWRRDEIFLTGEVEVDRSKLLRVLENLVKLLEHLILRQRRHEEALKEEQKRSSKR